METFPKKLFGGKMNAVTDKSFLFLLETWELGIFGCPVSEIFVKH